MSDILMRQKVKRSKKTVALGNHLLHLGQR